LDSVSITVPAEPAYLRVVRLVAAGLASRLGFTIDQIDDLKIAVDELAAYLTGSKGRDGDLEVSFAVHEDRIEITGSGHFSQGRHVRTELTELSRKILDTVADSATLERADGAPRFHLVKYQSSDAASGGPGQ
jgi:serine/threonine-protein kinase RsbW